LLFEAHQEECGDILYVMFASDIWISELANTQNPFRASSICISHVIENYYKETFSVKKTKRLAYCSQHYQTIG
jgi:hypothetical protein